MKMVFTKYDISANAEKVLFEHDDGSITLRVEGSYDEYNLKLEIDGTLAIQTGASVMTVTPWASNSIKIRSEAK